MSVFHSSRSFNSARKVIVLTPSKDTMPEYVDLYGDSTGVSVWCPPATIRDLCLPSHLSMSSFRAALRAGHLERIKRICGYLSKFRSACIRIRTEEPDYSDLPKHEYDWSHTIYDKVTERKAQDAPIPKGKPVVTTTYKDANLYHDLATGSAATRVLHFFNQTCEKIRFHILQIPYYDYYC